MKTTIDAMKQAETAINLVFSVGFDESTRSAEKRSASAADICGKARLALREAIAREEAQPKSFKKLYADNVMGIEIERLKIALEKIQGMAPEGFGIQLFIKTTLDQS